MLCRLAALAQRIDHQIQRIGSTRLCQFGRQHLANVEIVTLSPGDIIPQPCRPRDDPVYHQSRLLPRHVGREASVLQLLLQALRQFLDLAGRSVLGQLLKLGLDRIHVFIIDDSLALRETPTGQTDISLDRRPCRSARQCPQHEFGRQDHIAARLIGFIDLIAIILERVVEGVVAIALHVFPHGIGRNEHMRRARLFRHVADHLVVSLGITAAQFGRLGSTAQPVNVRSISARFPGFGKLAHDMVRGARSAAHNQHAQRGLIGGIRPLSQIVAPALVRIGNRGVGSVLHQRCRLFAKHVLDQEFGQEATRAGLAELASDKQGREQFASGFGTAFNKSPSFCLIDSPAARAILGIGWQAGLQGSGTQRRVRTAKRNRRTDPRQHLRHRHSALIQAKHGLAAKGVTVIVRRCRVDLALRGGVAVNDLTATRLGLTHHAAVFVRRKERQQRAGIVAQPQRARCGKRIVQAIELIALPHLLAAARERNAHAVEPRPQRRLGPLNIRKTLPDQPDRLGIIGRGHGIARIVAKEPAQFRIGRDTALKRAGPEIAVKRVLASLDQCWRFADLPREPGNARFLLRIAPEQLRAEFAERVGKVCGLLSLAHAPHDIRDRIERANLANSLVLLPALFEIERNEWTARGHYAPPFILIHASMI